MMDAATLDTFGLSDGWAVVDGLHLQFNGVTVSEVDGKNLAHNSDSYKTRQAADVEWSRRKMAVASRDVGPTRIHLADSSQSGRRYFDATVFLTPEPMLLSGFDPDECGYGEEALLEFVDADDETIVVVLKALRGKYDGGAVK